MAVKTALIKFDAQMTAAYKQAVQAYANIQKTVNGMSAQWQRANSGLLAHVQTMRQAQAVMQQNATAMRGLVNAQANAAQNARVMATQWGTTAKHVHGFVTTLKDFYNFGKRVGLVALAGGGGSIYGIDRLATSLASGRMSAIGRGMSYGQQQAFGLAFSRFGDPASMLNAVSTGRGDTSSQQASAMFAAGVNPMGQGNTGQQALRYLEWIQSKVAGRSDAELGYLMRGYNTSAMGYDIETLRRVRDQPDEVNEMRKKFEQDQKQLNLQDKSLKAWQDFITQLETAGERLKAVLGEGLVKLAGPLGDLSKSLVDAVKTITESGGFKWAIEKISEGIKQFAAWVGSDSFKTDLTNFMQSIKAVTQGLAHLAIFLFGSMPSGGQKGMADKAKLLRRDNEIHDAGGIFGRGGVAKTDRGLQNNAKIIGGWAGRIGRYLFGKGYDPSKTLPPIINPNVGGHTFGGNTFGGNTFGGKTFGASANDSKGGIFGGGLSGDYSSDVNFFMSKGWSKEQAIGIVANIEGESSGNPFAWGDGGQAYGLAQWHPERRAAYRMLFGHKMEEVKDFNQARMEQLAFIDWELHNTEQRAGRELSGARTTNEATAAVVGYERPADTAGAISSRSAIANKIHAGIPQSTINIHNFTGSALSISSANLGVTQK